MQANGCSIFSILARHKTDISMKFMQLPKELTKSNQIRLKLFQTRR